MLNSAQAAKIAQNHLDELPIPSAAYRWVLTVPIRTGNGWVFEYQYECIDGTPPEEWEAIGGAPGFLVSDDETITVLTWNEMRPR